ncbi:hypothetical protein RJ639_000810 [Escallonia herrerae]|uniref:Uncharacterized protein n=1 Tax=Escallonia herrerae TaxID=1293975 RepID=A0AA89BN39_9ASTE|nr:hypothetical protein RJ639_000810 [Escallonia herrerae]
MSGEFYSQGGSNGPAGALALRPCSAGAGAGAGAEKVFLVWGLPGNHCPDFGRLDWYTVTISGAESVETTGKGKGEKKGKRSRSVLEEEASVKKKSPIWKTKTVPSISSIACVKNCIYSLGAPRKTDVTSRKVLCGDITCAERGWQLAPRSCRMIRGRKNARSITVDGKIYTFGGIGKDKERWAEVLDPVTGQSFALSAPPFTLSEYHLFACAFDDGSERILVGYRNYGVMFVYSIRDNTWRVLEDKLESLYGICEPVLVEGCLYWLALDADHISVYDLDRRMYFTGEIKCSKERKLQLHDVAVTDATYYPPFLHLGGDVFSLLWLQTVYTDGTLYKGHSHIVYVNFQVVKGMKSVIASEISTGNCYLERELHCFLGSNFLVVLIRYNVRPCSARAGGSSSSARAPALRPCSAGAGAEKVFLVWGIPYNADDGRLIWYTLTISGAESVETMGKGKRKQRGKRSRPVLEEEPIVTKKNSIWKTEKVPSRSSIACVKSCIYSLGASRKVRFGDLSCAEQGWNLTPRSCRMIRGRKYARSVTVDGKIFTFGGIKTDKEPWAEVLDPDMGQSFPLSAPPSILSEVNLFACAFDDDSKRILVGCLERGVMFVYSICSKTWEVLEDKLKDLYSMCEPICVYDLDSRMYLRGEIKYSNERKLLLYDIADSGYIPSFVHLGGDVFSLLWLERDYRHGDLSQIECHSKIAYVNFQVVKGMKSVIASEISTGNYHLDRICILALRLLKTGAYVQISFTLDSALERSCLCVPIYIG